MTAGGLSNAGVIKITGNGTIVSALDVNGPATNNATVNIDASGEVLMGAGDAYTQAAGATNINGGGMLTGTVTVTGGAVNVVSGGTLAGTPRHRRFARRHRHGRRHGQRHGGTVFGGPKHRHTSAR